MCDLEKLSFTEMIRLGSTLRKLGDGAGNMEEVADRLVRDLQHHLVSQLGQQARVLFRPFMTYPLGELDHEFREFAVAQLGGVTARTELDLTSLLLDLMRVRVDAWRPQRQRGTQ